MDLAFCLLLPLQVSHFDLDSLSSPLLSQSVSLGFWPWALILASAALGPSSSKAFIRSSSQLRLLMR